ncbi:hypothetical protein RRG08_009719 [Elysia crispata]|uniref:Uncharacterized protein n=1 Tax=Elysia crispata TaxID=231223 RepID=A0AAE1CTZ9_9GAST|nr:hypothetical protein RRG08_009719 [Elysia crispata]
MFRGRKKITDNKHEIRQERKTKTTILNKVFSSERNKISHRLPGNILAEVISFRPTKVPSPRCPLSHPISEEAAPTPTARDYGFFKASLYNAIDSVTHGPKRQRELVKEGAANFERLSIWHVKIKKTNDVIFQGHRKQPALRYLTPGFNPSIPTSLQIREFQDQLPRPLYFFSPFPNTSSNIVLNQKKHRSPVLTDRVRAAVVRNDASDPEYCEHLRLPEGSEKTLTPIFNDSLAPDHRNNYELLPRLSQDNNCDLSMIYNPISADMPDWP